MEKIFECEKTDEHESPIGGGIKTIRIRRAQGTVPTIFAAYDRGSGWFDDSLKPFSPPDRYDGSFPIQKMANFEGMPDRSFKVRFYGTWSDNGEAKAFTIDKKCTASQTEIYYYNAYDTGFPNVIITITWDREYSPK